MIIYFLYGRQFASEASRGNRIKRMKKFIKDAKTKERMLNVMSLNEDCDAVELENIWAYGQMSVLLYSALKGANTIFSGRRMVFVCRLQHSENCYMHASSNVVGYKIAFGKEDGCYETESFDAEKHLRNWFTNDKLEYRVVKDGGAYSKAFLKTVIPESKFLEVPNGISDPITVEYITKLLRKHGPALLSCFQTNGLFKGGRAKIQKNGYKMAQFDIACKEPAVSFCVKDNISFAPEVETFFTNTFGMVETLKFIDLGMPTEKNSSDLDEIQKVQRGKILKFHHKVHQDEVPPGTTLSMDSDDGDQVATPDESEHEGFQNMYDFEGLDVEGSHAMVLIGFRKEKQGDGSEKIWFLVQNTWKKMVLVEMSPAYLSKHIYKGGGICFIKEPVTKLPEHIPHSPYHVIESMFCGGGDEAEEINHAYLEEK
jgi:hypothetical protein